MSHLPRYAAFAACVGTPLTASTPAGPIVLDLIGAEASRPAPDMESFTLLFRGPGERYLPQGIYHLEHTELGALDLFIVPVRQDAQGLYYEAVFNMAVS